LRKWILRFVYVLFCVAGVAVTLEIGARVIYEHYRGREFSRDDTLGRLLGERVLRNPLEELPPDVKHRVAELKDTNIPDAPVILHPYFGFVITPSSGGINDYGFFADSPLVHPEAQTVTVAIFGGSLADQVFYMGQDVLIDVLEHSPRFAGKSVRVVSTAVGGYKQPQQLNVLSFMLARGAAYDFVVNIDGFNEIDSSIENFLSGINPYFPHNWKLHARRGLDPEATAKMGRINLLRERRQRRRETFARLPLHASTFVLVLWDLLDAADLESLRRETRALKETLHGTSMPPRVAGPPHHYTDEDSLYDDLVTFWARSSLDMDAICDRYGISYLHFLQPNQYVPNSKVLTDEERRLAFDEHFVGFERVPHGFPMLSRRGAILRDNGVNFVDLTDIFADESRTVYSDICCHVNELGADLIAERVAREILAAQG